MSEFGYFEDLDEGQAFDDGHAFDDGLGYLDGADYSVAGVDGADYGDADGLDYSVGDADGADYSVDYDLIGVDPDEDSLWNQVFSGESYDGVYDSVNYTDFGTNPYVAA